MCTKLTKNVELQESKLNKTTKYKIFGSYIKIKGSYLYFGVKQIGVFSLFLLYFCINGTKSLMPGYYT